MIPAPPRLHATAILLGETGLLIRGASGSGKTGLALALISEAARNARFARLVGDDVVAIELRSGRLIARPHPAIEGKVERRGLGVMAVEHAPACVVRAVVDIAGAGEPRPDRLPSAETLRVSIGGVELPRLPLCAGTPLLERVSVVFDFLVSFRAGS